VVRGARYGVLGARHEVQNTLYDYPTKRNSPRNMSIRGTECEVRGTRYRVPGTRYKVRGTGYGACGTRYEVRGAGCMVQVTRGHK
jgi:hypothetical protein